jgi:hypothetical protein
LSEIQRNLIEYGVISWEHKPLETLERRGKHCLGNLRKLQMYVDIALSEIQWNWIIILELNGLRGKERCH